MDSSRIRNSAKALILQHGRILVTENHDSKGPWYCLPGGGQILGETLTQAVSRECLEEIGTAIEVGDLMFIREYIADHHEPHEGTAGLHQIDFVFQCRVPETYVASNGHAPDSTQQAVRWMTIGELRSVRFFPQALLVALEAGDDAKKYLGNVN